MRGIAASSTCTAWRCALRRSGVGTDCGARDSGVARALRRERRAHGRCHRARCERLEHRPAEAERGDDLGGRDQRRKGVGRRPEGVLDRVDLTTTLEQGRSRILHGMPILRQHPARRRDVQVRSGRSAGASASLSLPPNRPSTPVVVSLGVKIVPSTGVLRRAADPDRVTPPACREDR